jgi:exo-beta-1,3-glucanase (GH17 family)
VRWIALTLAALVGSATAARALSVEKILGGGRLVAYVPRTTDGPPSPRALRTDAESLHAVGFRAVTTFGTSHALVPVCRFFKRRGFRTVLVGIRDPRDRAEIGRAARLKRCADGYVVGSGGLAAGRYGRADLDRAIHELREVTGRPVTTREPLRTYTDDPTLVRAGDWVFPTIEPWDADKREAQDACGWTIFAYRDLAEHAPAGVAAVVGATGLPTDGALATSEHYQRAYFMCLESRQVPFAYFEAFDEPSRPDDGVGAHWGLFRADGSPKLWAAQQIVPALTVERAGGVLRGRVDGGPRRMLRVVAYVEGPQWEALPPVIPDRRGAWRLAVPAGRAVAVYVVWAGWTPPPAGARPPQVDRQQILVERELPPM